MHNWFIFVGVFVMIACFGLGTYQHELVHVQNNEAVGCESNIYFGIYKGLPAIGVQRIGEFKEDMTNYELAQSFNEAIGYNLNPLLIGLMLTMFLGFFYIGEKVNKKC